MRRTRKEACATGRSKKLGWPLETAEPSRRSQFGPDNAPAWIRNRKASWHYLVRILLLHAPSTSVRFARSGGVMTMSLIPVC